MIPAFRKMTERVLSGLRDGELRLVYQRFYGAEPGPALTRETMIQSLLIGNEELKETAAGKHRRRQVTGPAEPPEVPPTSGGEAGPVSGPTMGGGGVDG